MDSGLTLYGDYAGLNSETMTSSFLNVGAGYKYGFNFYQSQVIVAAIAYVLEIHL